MLGLRLRFSGPGSKGSFCIRCGALEVLRGFESCLGVFGEQAADLADVYRPGLFIIGPFNNFILLGCLVS